jgi:hypothetical protein
MSEPGSRAEASARRRSPVRAAPRPLSPLALAPLDAIRRTGVVGWILAAVVPPAIRVSPFLVEQRTTARAATLVGEERLEGDRGEDPPAA